MCEVMDVLMILMGFIPFMTSDVMCQMITLYSLNVLRFCQIIPQLRIFKSNLHIKIKYWGRMDTCICTAEPLLCAPETVTTLLVACVVV